MIDGAIRLKEDEHLENKLRLLKTIYEHESNIISGPGSQRRDITEVLWTLAGLSRRMNLTPEQTGETEKLLDWMEQKRHLMVIREEAKENRYITRVAEIVRLLGHNYEYWHLGRPGVEAVRWVVEEKRVPRREPELSAESFIIELKDVLVEEGIVDQYPKLNESIDLVVEGVSKNLCSSDWRKARYSRFQFNSTIEMLRAQFKDEHPKSCQILTADVGGGKTIAFTMSVLISAVEGLLSGERSRRTHLLLYPRTALARDQWKKISGFAESIANVQLEVHLEHIDFYTSIMRTTVSEGLENKYGDGKPWRDPKTPPDVIITTLETLKRRLQHPGFSRSMSRFLKRIVMDEIHLVESLAGTQVIQLMSRLEAICDEDILWTGSSATVASPEKHAAKVFGLETREVEVIWSGKEMTELAGLAHHVFLRPSGLISNLGCLVNTTSLLIHNRRRNLSERGRTKKSVQKTIGFADNLDILGRWNADLRENERTEMDWGSRDHPDKSDRSEWGPLQRELPYALRYHNPFTRRLLAKPGKAGNLKDEKESEPYVDLIEIKSAVMEEIGDLDPCRICRNGVRKEFCSTHNRSELKELGRFVVRDPTKDDDYVKTFGIMNTIFDCEELTLGTLDLCPFLRAGACSWFPVEDMTEDMIPGTRFYDFRCQARSKIHSSKKKEISSDISDDLSDLVFKGSVYEVYDVGGEDTIPVDVVLSSPSLEVGIDVDNVTESVMFKAIRNVASYRQKAGRAGREMGSDTVNLTLLSGRAMDSHYYRQPRKLVSLAQLDPIPLKDYNVSLMRSSLYMAIWDHLASQGILPEVIPMGYENSKSRFATMLETCDKYLSEKGNVVARHLSMVSREKIDPNHKEITGAIDKAKQDIKMFLVPTSGVFVSPKVKCIADVVLNRISGSRNVMLDIDYGIKNKFEEIDEYSRKIRFELLPKINPIDLSLVEEFQDLNRMSKSGWDLTVLRKLLYKLESSQTESEEAEDLFRYANRISKRLSTLEALGINPVTWFFYSQFIDRFPSDKIGKAHYLSYIMEELPLFSGFGDSSYVRPKNLFTNPYEHIVELVLEKQSGSQVELEPVLIGEALHSFIPGTWTYRLGKEARKVRVGGLTPATGGSLISELSYLDKAGNRFVLEHSGIKGPPGMKDKRYDIYRPIRLNLMHASKFVRLDIVNRMIFDGDERSGKGPRIRIKIPTDYLERWVHIEPRKAERIHVLDHLLENIAIGLEGEVPDGIGVQDRISHPIMAKALKEVCWHDDLDVTEFVYEAGRAYSSKAVSGANLVYRDKGKEIGFGHRISTEGVSIVLNKATVEKTVNVIVEGMMEGTETWLPTALRALYAMMYSAEVEEGNRISPFMINDLLAVILHRALKSGGKISISSIIEDMIGLSKYRSHPEGQDELTQTNKTLTLSESPDNFRNDLRRYIKRKRLGITEEAAEETRVPEKERKILEEIEKEVNELFDMLGLFTATVFKDDFSAVLVDFLNRWTKVTLLNTFSICCLNALQRLSGTGDEKIGYCPDMEALERDEYRVFIYDRDINGNGTCRILREYMHILYIQRAPQNLTSRMLPTQDFLSQLEEELLQCPQFHTDINALEIHRQKGKKIHDGEGFPELAYVKEYSKEIEIMSGDVWDKLNIKGPNDAWRLPLINIGAMSISDKEDNLEKDDILRASGICWNGCPECVVGNQTLMGGIRGSKHIDKAILDIWYNFSREGVEEYKHPTPDQIKDGTGFMDVGRLSQVTLELPHRVLRSVSLPFVVGFELNRDSPSSGARLVLRDDDILGLKLPRQLDEVPTTKIVPIGFGRLVWNTLLTTAYLEAIGKLKKEDKRLQLVFYVITDVKFKDIGMSERMWEAIESRRREDGFNRRLENLSDFLGWLAMHREFEISVCVDVSSPKLEAVKSFLTKLRAFDPDGRRISIATKSIPKGLMHGKGLWTPVGCISGSNNLTNKSINEHEEFLSYSAKGTQAYEDLTHILQDSLRQSKPWER